MIEKIYQSTHFLMRHTHIGINNTYIDISNTYIGINNTYIDNAKWKLTKSLAKVKLHPEASRYHPKIIEDILENVQYQLSLFKKGYMFNGNENKTENEK